MNRPNDLWRSIFPPLSLEKNKANFIHIQLQPPADFGLWCWHVKYFISRGGKEKKTEKLIFYKVESWLEIREMSCNKNKFCDECRGVSIVLTGAIKASGDGVQKGVLWGQEALHHRHLDPDVGWPTAGWKLHHPRCTAGGFQGVSAGAGGDFEGLVAGTHIYSHTSPSNAASRLGRLK